MPAWEHNGEEYAQYGQCGHTGMGNIPDMDGHTGMGNDPNMVTQARLGPVKAWPSLVWPDQARPGPWLGQARHGPGLATLGLVWPGHAHPWPCQARPGQVLPD